MDGHEHPDVVEYRDNVFLPTMAKYEELMTKYEGPALEKVPPKLKEGERRLLHSFMMSAAFTPMITSLEHGSKKGRQSCKRKAVVD